MFHNGDKKMKFFGFFTSLMVQEIQNKYFEPTKAKGNKSIENISVHLRFKAVS